MKTHLRVSENRRFLTHADGSPFFYLADTAWGLFQRTTRKDAEKYFNDRAAKGFNVIQAVVLSEFDGLTVPNFNGDVPLHDLDPTRPNEAYFHHVDWIVEQAAQRGLFVGMLPTWGDKWNLQWGSGPEIFTPENARIYGQWLAERYRDAPIIWILGGDRAIETEEHRAITDAMASGIVQGDGGQHLMSFHPVGGHSSAEWFHQEDWLDFNMWQSGHTRNRDNYRSIHSDYALELVKPCLDSEPGYEGHPTEYQGAIVELNELDVRKSAYWSIFAGACGHTYGSIYQCLFWQPGMPLFRESWVHQSWHDAMHLPGSAQMIHLRRLIESRPYFERIPDQQLIVSGQSDEAGRHLQATRAADGSYAFVYVPGQQRLGIDSSLLSGDQIVAHWFDPRTGAAIFIGEFARGGELKFETPDTGPDWVLMLDDKSRGFALPDQLN